MFRKILAVLIAGLFIIGITNLSFAMMCHGGGQKHTGHSDAEHKHNAETADKQSGEKEVVLVGNKACPISGEAIDEKKKSTYEYEGKIYSFCCPSCIDEFKKAPDKYIKKVDEELEKTTE